jgi:hypothetical protein
MNSRSRISRYLYTAVAWLFVAGILNQVFLVGLSLLGRQPSWVTHTELGHSLIGAPLLMIILAYVGRLPGPMKAFTWLASSLYILLVVAVVMRESAPLVAAFHPVLAVLLFGTVGFLAIRAWRLVRESADTGMVTHPTAEAIGD